MTPLLLRIRDVFSLVIFLLLIALGHCYTVLQTLEDVVGAENFTYYRLSRPGVLLLELETIKGDADIYVSDTTHKPTYSNFELHSVTCGKDVVELPSHFSRPVGIGIYGHPSYVTSHYRLSIIHLADSDGIDYPEFEEDSEAYQELQNSKAQHEDNVDDEPFLWQIFITVLKVTFDILL